MIQIGSTSCGDHSTELSVAPPPPQPEFAVHELLQTLGLDRGVEGISSRLPGARLETPVASIVRFAHRNGLFVQEISVPARVDSGPPRTGIDILRSELADVDRFELLYSKDGSLDAILPAGDALGALKDGWFMDLTPYAVDPRRFSETSDEDLARLARSMVDRRRIVADYIQFRNLSQRLRPVDALAKKPYVLVTLDTHNGEVGLQEFGPVDLIDGRRKDLVNQLRNKEGRTSLVYPIYPTVYSPGVANNEAQARNFGRHVCVTLKALEPDNGDQILDVGTGSGYLSWVAWATSRSLGKALRMYALDINPLAVANARAMARLAGFPIAAMAHDNVVAADGFAFPGTTFRFVIWDMPALPRLLKPHLIKRDSAEQPRQFMEYWDDGSTALRSLETFAGALPKLLARVTADATPSTAVLWNTAPLDVPDAIPRTFTNAGLSTRLLDTYTSGGGAITCVVYAVMLPPSRAHVGVSPSSGR